MYKNKKIKVEGESFYLTDVFYELNENDNIHVNNFRGRVDKKPGKDWTVEELTTLANKEIKKQKNNSKYKENKRTRKKEAMNAPGESIRFWVDHTNFWKPIGDIK